MNPAPDATANEPHRLAKQSGDAHAEAGEGSKKELAEVEKWLKKHGAR